MNFNRKVNIAVTVIALKWPDAYNRNQEGHA